MQLNTVRATPEQIEKITDKYLCNPINRFFRCSPSVAYDGEDKIYFVTVVGATYKYEYQVRGRTPMFFGLIKGQTRYDVDEPSGKLLEYLSKESAKALASWKAGNHL